MSRLLFVKTWDGSLACIDEPDKLRFVSPVFNEIIENLDGDDRSLGSEENPIVLEQLKLVSKRALESIMEWTNHYMQPLTEDMNLWTEQFVHNSFNFIIELMLTAHDLKIETLTKHCSEKILLIMMDGVGGPDPRSEVLRMLRN